MVKRVDGLTPAQIARMPEWRDKWIKVGLSTDPMLEADRREVERAIRAMYRKSNLPEPKVVIFVPSPFVLRVAAGIAAGVIYAHRNGWPKGSFESGAVHGAVDGAVRGAVSGAVGGAVGGAVSGAVHGAVDGAVRGAVDGAVDGAVSGAVGGAVHGAVDGAVGGAVSGAVHGAVRGAVSGAVGGAVHGAVDGAVRGAVDGAVHGAVRGAVDGAVGGAVGGAVHGAVRGAVDGAVGGAVHGAVRGAVDGATIYLLRCVREWDAGWGWYWGGNLWASWPSWFTYFRDVCGLELDRDVMDKMAALEVAYSQCGPFTLHQDFAMVCDRPNTLKRDAGGRLHASDGPAIAWRDGYSLCFWHGLHLARTHEWIVREPTKLTPAEIEREPNAELRRVMLEAFGFEKYIAARHGLVIDEDELHGQSRRLIEIEIVGDRLQVAEVVNGSLEPDGTRRKFHLGAARDPRTRSPVKTIAHAIAHSYGIAPEHYREAVRT